ncbi:hypothetical protein SAMN05428642_101750 [Flaviramulus basaltis]|uniref:Uncharacterized protein n=1 Tax=Flaviramulus basaltis TaxID=369401 RepID=A0A1K2ICJ5_9FLAO|nr:hypothetical protein [Flaviramulus basaltis]SFZ90119.1 hypothetical protein SAMN05428642_101750 [Flaviramulus basaltis]
MKLLISKSNFAFFLLAISGLLFSVFSYYILPEKYFWDSNTIINNDHGFTGLMGSFPFSIWFYKVTGLKYLSREIIAIIQYSILVYLLYKIGISKDLHKFLLKNIIIYLMFLMLAIYVAVPSKEFINYIYISFIVFFVIKRKTNIGKTIFISIFLMIFFSWFFRPYYFIIAIIAFFMYIMSYIKIKNYKTATILYGLLLLIFISLSYGVIKGEFISEQTRDVVNNSRMGEDYAKTIIKPPLENDTWYGESISVIHGFFSVNLPVNGLRHFLSPQIVIFILWQLILFYILIRKYEKSIREGKRNNYELWLFYILFSYFIVQGVFEPDLGSALRHKASVFPIIYYLLNYESFRKKAK